MVKFGDRKWMNLLTPIVFPLYNNALATSSKQTYKTGTNHFPNFLKKFPQLCNVKPPVSPPSVHILSLCFFAVSLYMKKSIKSASTIRSYVRHVKHKWIQNGCDPESLDSEVLSRVLKGLRKDACYQKWTLGHPSYSLTIQHFR